MEKEAINSGWSIRELKRQISTALYERLLLSEGKTNKKKQCLLSQKKELKTTKLTPEAAGQLNMYLNYYAAEINDEHDNPPIGIILCTDKDSIAAEYALGGLSNNIFASRYVSYIPDKEQLIAQVEAVLNEWHKQENK
mgnify:CR=1 FL=1